MATRKREQTITDTDTPGSPPPPGAWARKSADLEAHPGGAPPLGGRRHREPTDVQHDPNLDSRALRPPGSGGWAPPRQSPALTAVQPRRRIAGWLLSEDRHTSHILRSGSNLVGRDPEHDILIDDAMVSGLQCNVICEADRTLLMPRPEARNPSVIDGKRVYTTETIPPFATVQFAGSIFTYIPVPKPSGSKDA